MATLAKAQSEDLMTEPNQDTIDDIQEVMTRKAQELFRLCDKEQKGFINRKDMQRLREELPVSPEQLEVVFDSLDEDGNGFLTLEEFTEGFGAFLGFSPKPESKKWSEEDEETEALDETYDPAMEDKVFADMLRQVGASHAFQDEDVVKAMWQKLYREDPDMASTFEEFLGRISDDMQRSKGDFHSLETALLSKSNEHEEEVKKLYEEMELQIKQEREKILAQEKAKEKHIKDAMDMELMEKERQLQDIASRQMELEKKIEELNIMEASQKQENATLQKEKERLEEMLGHSQDSLEESRTYINQMQMQQKDEKRERARAALMLSEGIAVERESLVKQLDILKDVNKRLRDDKDEAEATETRLDQQKRLQLLRAQQRHLRVSQNGMRYRNRDQSYQHTSRVAEYLHNHLSMHPRN